MTDEEIAEKYRKSLKQKLIDEVENKNCWTLKRGEQILFKEH